MSANIIIILSIFKVPSSYLCNNRHDFDKRDNNVVTKIVFDKIGPIAAAWSEFNKLYIPATLPFSCYVFRCNLHIYIQDP